MYANQDLVKVYPKVNDPLIGEIDKILSTIREMRKSVAPDSVEYIQYVTVESYLRAAQICYIEDRSGYLEEIVGASEIAGGFGFSIAGLSELVASQIQNKGGENN